MRKTTFITLLGMFLLGGCTQPLKPTAPPLATSQQARSAPPAVAVLPTAGVVTQAVISDEEDWDDIAYHMPQRDPLYLMRMIVLRA